MTKPRRTVLAEAAVIALVATVAGLVTVPGRSEIFRSGWDYLLFVPAGFVVGAGLCFAVLTGVYAANTWWDQRKRRD